MYESKVTMRELFESGVHFGHLTRFRNPKMAPYIYGSKNKVNIIAILYRKIFLRILLT